MNPLVAKKVAAVAAQSPKTRRLGLFVVVATVVLVFAGPMFLVALAAGGFAGDKSPNDLATGEIPPDALAAYIDAADTWKIDWTILAAVGSVECDHGRYQADGCNPPGTMNHAGARGYMQFIGSTWRAGLGQHEMEPRASPPAPDGHGYATDGDGDGAADPWNWADATHSAARYLVALGVNDDADSALYGYNHSTDYVAEVLRRAATYRSGGDATVIGNTPNGPVTAAEIVTVQGIRVHRSIASNLDALLHDAHRDGLVSLSGGGYRDAASQIATRRANCGTSHYAIYQMPSSSCSPPTATPGRSMHERGLAIDFTIDGSIISSRNSAAFRWMAANAAHYGLYNLPSEPWHWSVNGN